MSEYVINPNQVHSSEHQWCRDWNDAKIGLTGKQIEED